MYIFAEPVTEEQVQELQNKNAAAIEEFERELLGISEKDEDEADKWEEIQAKVEEAMDEDERGIEEAEEGEDVAPAASEFDDGQDGAEGVAAYGESEDESNADIDAGLANGAAIDDVEEKDEEHLADEDEDVDESEDSEIEGTEEDKRVLGEGEEIEDIAKDEAAGEGHDIEEAQDEEEAEEYQVEEDDAGSEETLVEDPPRPDGSASEESLSGSTIDQGSDSEELLWSSVISDAQSESEPSSVDEITTSPAEEQSFEFDSTADPTFLNDITNENEDSVIRPPILAMTLTIRNKVDGKYVLRPTNLASTPTTSPYPYPAPVQTKWSVEYTLREVEDLNRAWTLYEACQERRRKQLDKSEGERKDDGKYQLLMKDLAAMGKKYRKGLDEREAGMEKVVLGWDGKVEGGVGKGPEAEKGSGGME